MLELETLLAAGLIAGAFRLAGDIPYFITTFRGTTKPHRISWLIWTILALELGISYAFVGATYTLWVPFIAMFATVSIFVLAIRQHEEGWKWLSRLFTHENWKELETIEKWSLAVGLIGIVGWAVSTDPFFAVVSALVADLAGAFAMIPKTWRDPGSENKFAWIMYVTSGFANLFAAEWAFTLSSFEIWIYVASMFISDGIILVTIVFGSLWIWIIRRRRPEDLQT